MFQFALPHLRKTEGSIINDTSLVAQIGQPGAVTYVATKVNSHVVRLLTGARCSRQWFHYFFPRLVRKYFVHAIPGCHHCQ